MEALILFLVILTFGFLSFPLYSYFIFVGIYSSVFFDTGIALMKESLSNE